MIRFVSSRRHIWVIWGRGSFPEIISLCQIIYHEVSGRQHPMNWVPRMSKTEKRRI